MMNFLLLLLLRFISYSGSSTKPVSGIKGGNVTLSCESEDREIVDISLISLSKIIPVCEKKNCSGRVFKEGSCDVIIKDLIYSDAGKYTLYVFYNNDQTEVERQIRRYQLCIHDSLTVRKGEELVLGDLPFEAERVEHYNGTVWIEVWRRGRGVLDDRLTDSNGRLVIREFKSSDAGIYRVLNSTGGELVTTNVTESEGNLTSTDDHRLDDTEQHSAWVWIVAPLALVSLIIFIMRTRLHLNRNKQPDSYKVEMGESEL